MNPIPKTRIYFQLPGALRPAHNYLECPSTCELPQPGDEVHLPEAFVGDREKTHYRVSKRVFRMFPGTSASEVVLVLE